MLTIVCVAPGRLERREMPLPEAAPGLVAVDIRAVGICGTDYHIFEGTHPFLAYPRIMGHELSGVVAATDAQGAAAEAAAPENSTGEPGAPEAAEPDAGGGGQAAGEPGSLAEFSGSAASAAAPCASVAAM